jgi:hypothetical protein
MGKYCWVLLILGWIFLFSCNNKRRDDKAPSIANVNNANENNRATLNQFENEKEFTRIDEFISIVDSFHLGGYSFVIYKENSLSNIIFEQKELVSNRDDEIDLLDGIQEVIRYSDSLSFTINEELTKYFVDHQIDAEQDEFKDRLTYFFQGEQYGIDYWRLFFVGYEYTGTLLVNKQTGEEKQTLNKYIYGPDSNFIISYNNDLDTRFEENGFHLLMVDNRKLLDGGMKELANWAPRNIVYNSVKDEFYIQAEVIDGYTIELDTFVMRVVPLLY